MANLRTRTNTVLRPSLPWYGGKQRLAKKIVNLMPPHKIYVEPFGGMAAVLLAKQPSEVEVYADLNYSLCCYHWVLQDDEQLEKFLRWQYLTPYGRSPWRDTSDDKLLHACYFYYQADVSFAACVGSAYGLAVTSSSNASARCNALRVVCEEAHRFKNVIVEHSTWQDTIAKYDSSDTLFYIDPPYLLETRIGGKRYECEMTYEDHVELVDTLRHVQGKVILSGYPNSLYESLGWPSISYTAHAFSTARTRITGRLGTGGLGKRAKRIETIWTNFTPHGSKGNTFDSI